MPKTTAAAFQDADAVKLLAPADPDATAALAEPAPDDIPVLHEPEAVEPTAQELAEIAEFERLERQQADRARIRELEVELRAQNAKNAAASAAAAAPRARRRVEPGESIHFLKSGLIFRYKCDAYSSETSRRAQTVTVTGEFRELSTDADGACWLDLADDDAAQLDRWGRVYIRRGPAPASLSPWEPGSAEEDVARERALAEAWAMPEGPAQDAAVARVRRTFGRRATSQTIQTMGSR